MKTASSCGRSLEDARREHPFDADVASTHAADTIATTSAAAIGFPLPVVFARARPGIFRSRASAKTPRVDAVAAPRPDGHHVQEHDHEQDLQHQVGDPRTRRPRPAIRARTTGRRRPPATSGTSPCRTRIRRPARTRRSRRRPRRATIDTITASGIARFGSSASSARFAADLEAHEDQHAVQDAEQDPGVARRLGRVERLQAVLGRVDDHVDEERRGRPRPTPTRGAAARGSRSARRPRGSGTRSDVDQRPRPRRHDRVDLEGGEHVVA